MGEPAHPDELIKPAVEGTLRVLGFSKAAGVRRIVVTSSILAVSSDMHEGTCGPDDWADPDKVGSYAKSKILAERAAWKFIDSQVGDNKMELVVLNPGGIMGPTLTGKVAGTSTGMISDMIKGKMPLVPNIATGMVDVRDVAKMHVAAISVAEAVGQRFILASDEPVHMMDVANFLKSAGFDKVSTWKAPTFLLKFLALFSKEMKGMITFIGKRVNTDNRSSREILGWQPTPMEQSIVEMAKSFSNS